MSKKKKRKRITHVSPVLSASALLLQDPRAIEILKPGINDSQYFESYLVYLQAKNIKRIIAIMTRA